MCMPPYRPGGDYFRGTPGAFLAPGRQKIPDPAGTPSGYRGPFGSRFCRVSPYNSKSERENVEKRKRQRKCFSAMPVDCNTGSRRRADTSSQSTTLRSSSKALEHRRNRPTTRRIRIRVHRAFARRIQALKRLAATRRILTLKRRLRVVNPSTPLSASIAMRVRSEHP